MMYMIICFRNVEILASHWQNLSCVEKSMKSCRTAGSTNTCMNDISVKAHLPLAVENKTFCA